MKKLFIILLFLIAACTTPQFLAAPHLVEIGMTKEQVLKVWGAPYKEIRTVSKYGYTDQWIYSLTNQYTYEYCYLYFKDGKVIGIQR